MSTPNMNMTVPVVSTTVGPTYASEINTCMDVIDAHDHSPGYGAQIVSGSININGDLPFNGYSAKTLLSAAFSSQAAPISSALLNRVYVSLGELYYNDASGNQVKITAGGNVNVGSVGAITGMAGTTASVVYSNATKTFTFSQDSSYAAHLSCGHLLIHKGAAASESYITLASPTLSGSYTVTFPTAAPGSTLPVQMDTSGTLSAATIDTAMITAAAVTEIKRAASAATSSGTVSVSGLTSTSAAVVTGATVTLTTYGRPVMVMLQGIDGAMASADGSVRISNGSASTSHAELSWSMDAGSTFKGKCFLQAIAADAIVGAYYPAGSICAILEPAAGSTTIQLYYKITSGVNTPALAVNNCKVVAREF